jgi:hypothetical protein
MTPLNQLNKDLSALRNAMSDVKVAVAMIEEDIERIEKEKQQPQHRKPLTGIEKHLDRLENNNWKRRKKKTA